MSVRRPGNGNRPEYYARADLYLCPTTKASFGITLLEAMACGTPMVVSDITGFRELVDRGNEAVLVEKEDASAWAQAAIDLLGDPDRRAAMRAAGRQKPNVRLAAGRRAGVRRLPASDYNDRRGRWRRAWREPRD